MTDSPPGSDDRVDRPALEPDDDELFRRYRADGSRRVRNELVERHMGLAAHIARRFIPSTGGDDVRQVAMLGLIKAVDRFDPDLGTAFSAFAGLTIEGEIKRHFRDRTWTVRVPRSAKEMHLVVRDAGEELTQRLGRSPTVAEIADHVGVERDDVLRGLAAGAAYQIGAIDAITPLPDTELSGIDRAAVLAVDEPGYEDAERRIVVEDLLGQLEGRERAIVQLRFAGDKSQTEIAEIVGISQMHVSRLLRRSFELMRRRLDDAEATPVNDADPPG